MRKFNSTSMTPREAKRALFSNNIKKMRKALSYFHLDEEEARAFLNHLNYLKDKPLESERERSRYGRARPDYHILSALEVYIVNKNKSFDGELEDMIHIIKDNNQHIDREFIENTFPFMQIESTPHFSDFINMFQRNEIPYSDILGQYFYDDDTWIDKTRKLNDNQLIEIFTKLKPGGRYSDSISLRNSAIAIGGKKFSYFMQDRCLQNLPTFQGARTGKKQCVNVSPPNWNSLDEEEQEKLKIDLQARMGSDFEFNDEFGSLTVCGFRLRKIDKQKDDYCPQPVVNLFDKDTKLNYYAQIFGREFTDLINSLKQEGIDINEYDVFGCDSDVTNALKYVPTAIENRNAFRTKIMDNIGKKSMPLDKIDGQYSVTYTPHVGKKTLPKAVKGKLEEEGWTLKPNDIDYAYRITEQGKETQRKIGKILKSDEAILKKYREKKQTYGSMKPQEYVIHISSHPNDIMKKSTCQFWSSCESIGGVYGRVPKQKKNGKWAKNDCGWCDDIENSNAIAYITKPDSDKWEGRVMLRWCETGGWSSGTDLWDGDELQAYPEKYYGNPELEPMRDITKKILKSKGLMKSKHDGRMCVSPRYDGYSDVGEHSDGRHIKYHLKKAKSNKRWKLNGEI